LEIDLKKFKIIKNLTLSKTSYEKLNNHSIEFLIVELCQRRRIWEFKFLSKCWRRFELWWKLVI